MEADQFTSQSIIHALQHGYVPSRGLEHIVVGREGELALVRRDLGFAKSGGGWVRFVGGDYGAGKTFLCSLVRELAWREGFVVAAIDLGRGAPLHKIKEIYRRILEGMRLDHVRHAPAFEFILQEWLFNLQRDVQGAMGLNSFNPKQWTELSRIVEQEIGKKLIDLQIHNRSLGNALRAYYVASRQPNAPMAAAAIRWLTGQSDTPEEVRREFNITGAVGQDNALEFLQAMARLIVHIGYAGLIVICDDVEAIRAISRPANRLTAYENICALMDKAAQGTLPHCGFVFASAEDFIYDGIRGIASHPPLSQRLKPGRLRRQTREDPPPLILLGGFDQHKLHQVTLKVRDVHGLAHDWDPRAQLTNELVTGLVEKMAGHFGDNLKAIPRGFLKVTVDILDELKRHPHSPAAEVLARASDPGRIEEVEREEAHLLDYD
jgi:P-loop Domain of unknown function (DUF2791)